jgi:hypothetical protein
MNSGQKIGQARSAPAGSSPLTTAPPSSLPTLQLQDEQPLPVISTSGNSLDASFDSLNTTSPQNNGNGRGTLQAQTSNGQSSGTAGSLLNNVGTNLNGVLNSTKQ